MDVPLGAGWVKFFNFKKAKFENIFHVSEKIKTQFFVTNF